MDGTAEQPAGIPQQNGSVLSEGQVPVVQDGRITYWPGFEALLHYTLYQQASVKEGTLQLLVSTCDACNSSLLCVQLGWQIGEEGSVIMPEPIFTPRVCLARSATNMQVSMPVLTGPEYLSMLAAHNDMASWRLMQSHNAQTSTCLQRLTCMRCMLPVQEQGLAAKQHTNTGKWQPQKS